MALTVNDLIQIENILDDKLDEKLDEKFDEKLKILPTKDEFLDAMDKLMGEVQDEREEDTILDGRTSEHTHQIEKLEKIHPRGQHSAV